MGLKKRFQKDFFVPPKLSSILYNRYILFFVVFISLINMASYGLQNDFITPLIFILTSIITFQYNQNMLIVFTIALIVSNLVKFGSQLSLQEGMNGKSEPMIKDEDAESVNEEEEDDEGAEQMQNTYKKIEGLDTSKKSRLATKHKKHKQSKSDVKPTSKKVKPATPKPASHPAKPATPKPESFSQSTKSREGFATTDISSLRDTIQQTKDMIQQFRELKEDFKNIQ